MSGTDLQSAVLALVDMPWEDLGKALTCDEADVAFDALCALGRPATAQSMMIDHADTDDEGDRHQLRHTTETTPAGMTLHHYGWTFREDTAD